ncbi:non-SMC mitotic condensation complex subunit 1 [Acrasis kona]|uniref:Non-SMC mitotic condensation complex subunit 1 n=1 Tax=Acrasis kona TaxID=1008807 RepID=A0AAW2ZNC1_9EUKA
MILQDETAHIPFMDKAYRCIFKLCDSPHVIAEQLIGALNHAAKSQESTIKPSISFAKLIYTLGTCALLECIYVEEQFKQAKKHKSTSSSDNNNKQQVSTIEKELGLDPNTMHDHELEQFYQDKVEQIITPQGGPYHAFLPLIITLCTQSSSSSSLFACASITLCKYMCVSQSTCDAYLQLLFTLLQNSTGVIRSNLIVSIGDLACRHPNSVEPWITHVYSCLNDPHVHVRKDALMVLSHLALNDMVKLKGSNAVDMVMRANDDDASISHLCHAFFEEYARRSIAGGNNPVYNLIPEVLSRLSQSQQITNQQFQNSIKFMMAFVTKDKQVEKLVDKLCQRFSAISTVHDHADDDDDRADGNSGGYDVITVTQWRHVAYSLSLLPFNDKCVKKMIECDKHYRHAVADQQVFDTLVALATKNYAGVGKKSHEGLDKQVIHEWVDKITKRHDQLCDKVPQVDDDVDDQDGDGDHGGEDEEDGERVISSQTIAKPRKRVAQPKKKNTKKKTTATKKNTKKTSKKKKKKVDTSDEESASEQSNRDDDDDESQEEVQVAAASKSRKSITMSSDCDDSDDARSSSSAANKTCRSNRKDIQESEESHEEAPPPSRKKQPAKRTRGKPKKTAQESEEESQEEQAPTRRTRGKPSQSDGEDSPPPAQNTTVIKRRRLVKKNV